MESIPRFFEAPQGSFFLFGPRGTGKSTWIQQALPDAFRIDLLDPGVYRTYQARPERLIEVVRARNERTVVVDEVQKVPELLQAVHLLIEEDPNRHFILTGSSARKLKRAGVNLLAGRAVLKTMHPFMAAELGKLFSMQSALDTGLVPLVRAAPNARDVLSAYSGLYLKEEVQAESIVRNIGGFARFMETISLSHGGVLNISNVARECQVGRKTVEGYVEILEDLLLAFRVPVFSRRPGRATSTHPKFFLFDTGVFRALRPQGPLDQGDVSGPALEGLVAQHIRAWVAYGGNRGSLYFWRTKAGNEVDFVVYGREVFTAIEVKNTATIRPRDLRGLKAFLDDYPEARASLVYRGADRLRIDRILCVPCDEFLMRLRPHGPLLPSESRS